MKSLEIKNLTKRYEDFTLNHISFTLPAGCIMGLIGENGAGKSTTIKVIMGAVKKDEGEILIFGKNGEGNFKDVKEDIGVVLDEPGFPDSVDIRQINTIMKATYRNWDEEAFYKLIKQFSLPEKKRFKNYSRGMKMKVSIAVAMSHHAKLLVLDEATSGLDPIVRDEILDIFLEFTRNEENSILISSHIVSDLEKLCDYIAFLHKGNLIFCEEKDRLLEKYGKLQCSQEDAANIDEAAIVGKRENKYGVELLVELNMLPMNVRAEKTNIEDIMLYIAKGDGGR